MNQELQLILDSDLLENYLVGTTNEDDTLKAENYISKYPEVRKKYDELQENLETYARSQAIPVPDGLKEKILIQIRKEIRITSKFMKFAIAASFIILISAGASYFFWEQNQDLKKENTLVNHKMDDLQEEMREQLEDVRNQFIVLHNPGTKKYKVTGNKKAQELKAVTYVNPVKKLSYINVSNLPYLPEKQCFQMWAEVNGKMLNLGILKEVDEKLLALPYSDNAVGYITIEPEGGNESPTVENIVANIGY